MTTKVDPAPYPLDALPDTIRAAVEEVQSFIKAPVNIGAGATKGEGSATPKQTMTLEEISKVANRDDRLKLMADNGY